MKRLPEPIGALAFAAVLAGGNVAAGPVSRIYCESGRPPSVSFYLENDPLQSVIATYLRAEQAMIRPAMAMSGSNVVQLSGSANISTSATGKLTFR